MQGFDRKAYWMANLKLISVLLFFWAFVSFGLSIILVDWLDQFRFMGFKLGFWFSQQGSIFCFVLIIFAYIFGMKKIDHKFKVED